MNSEMAPLRAQVDLVDGQIVGLLARRFELTGRIGAIKARVGEAPRDPQRQIDRAQMLVSLARQHDVDEALLIAIYQLISSEVVERHRRTAAEWAAR